MIHNSVYCFLFSSSRQTTSKLWSYRDYKQVARKLPLLGFVKQSNNVLLTVEGREKKKRKVKKRKVPIFLGFRCIFSPNLPVSVQQPQFTKVERFKVIFQNKILTRQPLLSPFTSMQRKLSPKQMIYSTCTRSRLQTETKQGKEQKVVSSAYSQTQIIR